jgi:hypothetical protein
MGDTRGADRDEGLEGDGAMSISERALQKEEGRSVRVHDGGALCGDQIDGGVGWHMVDISRVCAAVAQGALTARAGYEQEGPGGPCLAGKMGMAAATGAAGCLAAPVLSLGANPSSTGHVR